MPHSVFRRKYSFRFRRPFGNFITFGKVSMSCTMTSYEKTKWTQWTWLHSITSFNSSEQLLACASWDFDSGYGSEKCFRLVQFNRHISARLKGQGKCHFHQKSITKLNFYWQNPLRTTDRWWKKWLLLKPLFISGRNCMVMYFYSVSLYHRFI